jgi:hypothetical protein
MKKLAVSVLLLAACHEDTAPPTASPSSSATVAPSVTTAAATSASSAEGTPSATATAMVANPPDADAMAAECRGAALTESALRRCVGGDLRSSAPPAGLLFTASASQVTVRSGSVATVIVTLTNGTSAAVLVPLDVYPTYFRGLQLAAEKLDLECISGSGPVKTEAPPPPQPTRATIELAAGGKLTWTQRIDANQHEHVIDRPKLVGFRGSGTPCLERDVPVSKGSYTVTIRPPARGLPPLPITVTVN